MVIQSNRDLRLGYELLGILARGGKIANPKVAEVKRSIRAFTNRPEPKAKIVRDDGIDGYVSLQQLPEFTDGYTAEEVNEYFREAEEIEPTYSAYDCTGRPFTVWFKVFRRSGHWFAYHSVGFDV